jgi:acid ceramidase
MILSYIYDLSAFCTSIIAKTMDNKILLSRNLDFTYPEEMRKIIYIAKFMRGGKLLYEATMFGTTNIVFTGMKPNSFSISLNMRIPS